MTSLVTASAPLGEEDLNGLIEAFNGTSSSSASIHYSRSATIFAAVAASIFTFVGITGKLISDQN